MSSSIFRINTNISAFTIQRQMFRASQMYSTALERLSSGLRINRASDDPAGLSMSEGFRSQIVGAKEADKNISRAVALLQTADSGFAQIGESLLRLKELYVAGADATLNADNRAALATEATAILAEIERIAESTSFNNMALIDTPGGSSFQFYVAPSSSGTNDTITVTIKGVDYTGSTLTIGGSTFTITPTTGTDFASPTAAEGVIDDIENAISRLAAKRTEVGAATNRLTRAQLNVQSQLENALNANSIIRDTDYAAETANMIRAQLLLNVGAALLAQANRMPQLVMTLLQSSLLPLPFSPRPF